MNPYYQKDGITIWHGNCLEILPTLAPVDHVITDPPYEAEAHTMGRRGNTARDGAAAFDAVRPLDFAAMTEADRVAVGSLMARLCRGWLLVFCQVEAAMLWRDACAPAKYTRTQIWRKPNGCCQFTGDRPGMGYESIVTCWGSKGRMKWNGGGRHGVYEHMTADCSQHPTTKPLALMRELVSLFTDPGDLILDPFMGSGTTLRAAKDLGRRAIGIELNERYCEIGAKRMAQGTLFTAPAAQPPQPKLI